jgi:hypothetical protein
MGRAFHGIIPMEIRPSDEFREDTASVQSISS